MPAQLSQTVRLGQIGDGGGVPGKSEQGIGASVGQLLAPVQHPAPWNPCDRAAPAAINPTQARRAGLQQRGARGVARAAVATSTELDLATEVGRLQAENAALRKALAKVQQCAPEAVVFGEEVEEVAAGGAAAAAASPAAGALCSAGAGPQGAGLLAPPAVTWGKTRVQNNQRQRATACCYGDVVSSV